MFLSFIESVEEEQSPACDSVVVQFIDMINTADRKFATSKSRSASIKMLP